MAEKKGERERTSSWAAKRRCSVPMQRVTIGEVIVLLREGGEKVSFLEGRSGRLDSEEGYLPAFDGAGICCGCSRFVGFFDGGGLLSKGPLLPTGACRFGGAVFREALLMVSPSSKHGDRGTVKSSRRSYSLCRK